MKVMKISWIVGCMLLLCMSFALAELADTDVAFEEFTAALEAEITSFEGQELPSAISPFISDETLEVHLLLDSGETMTFVFVVENSIIVQSGAGDIEYPGYTLTVSQSFVEANHGDAFGKAVRNGLTTGEVSYEANGLWRKMKLSVMLAAIDIAALFQ